MIHTLESFTDYYYKYNRFPDNSYINKDKQYNDKQLKAKYEKYIKSHDKQVEAVKRYATNTKTRTYNKIKNKEFAKGSNTDPQWIEVCKQVDMRDKTCILIQVLNPDEYAELCENSMGYHTVMTHAHCLPKSSHSKFYYKLENIYLLNLYSHELLDNGKDPITGIMISKEEQIEWWNRILAPYNITIEKLKELYLKS